MSGIRLPFVIAMLCAGTLAQSAAAEPPRSARDLVHLVRQDCGSCHGLTLQGGLGPALTPEALRERPREGLLATILGGRPGTPMPPFGSLLREEEAAWIVDQLLRGFPENGALPRTKSALP